MNKIFSKKSIKDTSNQAEAKEPNINSSVDDIDLVSPHDSSTPTIPAMGMGCRMHARFAAIGGIELELQSRACAPRAAIFD